MWGSVVVVAGDRVVLWIMFCVVGALCAKSWQWFISSIIFYSGNGFDFSEDFGPKIYMFDFTDDDRYLAKPREKFLIAIPFFVIMTSFVLLLIGLSLM
ncbi:hypothetical protein HLI17_28495 [Rhizobium laguerreae]|uniref:DUF3899 domain-containing protein n=2 Tax=Rhizobium laguerreae TaxID=1076926 RepID=A0A7Y2RAA2_9HYPH|nr:hypothetical protein [Rhizobium laguerreae]